VALRVDVTTDVPVGKRFSHVYIDCGEASEDSKRMRIRLRSLVVSLDDLRHSTLVEDDLE
jgi:hypothetical protein